MTRVVIVGEIFNADLTIGGGPVYPGFGGQPSHPWVPPGQSPPGFWGGMTPHPDQGLPGQSPPGYWGGGSPQPGHPIQPVPPGQGGAPGYPSHPIHIPGVPDQGLPPGEPVPPETYNPPDPPPELQDELLVSVYTPGQGWQTTSYDVQPDQGQPAPTPHRRR